MLLLVAIVFFLQRGTNEDNRHKTGDGEFPEQEELASPKTVRAVHQTSVYTIMELADSADRRFWLAAPRMELAVGDRVIHGPAEEARNFPAKSLNRTFDRILLARAVYKLDAQGKPVRPSSMDPGHGHDPHGHGGAHPGHGGEPPVKVPQLEQPADGKSLAEINSAAEKLAGQTIKVRGMVIKARQRVRPAAGAPPTNWYHLQDGSEAAATLVFTSSEEFQRGEIVVLTGPLVHNKDLGPGLRYKLFLESPQVQREKKTSEAK
jgi:hypothetical protein